MTSSRTAAPRTLTRRRTDSVWEGACGTDGQHFADMAEPQKDGMVSSRKVNSVCEYSQVETNDMTGCFSKFATIPTSN